MLRVQHGTLARYLFESFDGLESSHGIFARHGGASRGEWASLNAGRTVGDDPAHVEENHRRIYDALSIGPQAVVSPRQVHGDRVATVREGDGGRIFPQTDALISNVRGLYLLLRFADCVPVFFYAPQRQAIGLAHAGWQGTLKGIARKAAEAFMAAFDCRPEDVRVGIGPAIGPCCFQVGPEIVEQVVALYGEIEGLLTKAQPDGRANLDLWRLNAQQLRGAGLTHIEVAEVCTSCRVESFYSHRRERGHTGRLAAIIGLP